MMTAGPAASLVSRASVFGGRDEVEAGGRTRWASHDHCGAHAGTQLGQQHTGHPIFVWGRVAENMLEHPPRHLPCQVDEGAVLSPPRHHLSAPDSRLELLGDAHRPSA